MVIKLGDRLRTYDFSWHPTCKCVPYPELRVAHVLVRVVHDRYGALSIGFTLEGRNSAENSPP